MTEPISLAYETRGVSAAPDVPPLLLLHGNGENRTYFKFQLAEFSASRRVIAVDTRGHGESPRGNAPFTLRQFAEDLRAFLDAHEIPRADLLGFSDGANVALLFALKYPERVRKLVLNGPNLNGRGVRATTQVPIVLGYRIASLFANRSARAKRNAELLNLMVNDPELPPETLCEIRADTLVVAGTRDMIKESHTRLIASKIPGAELAFVRGNHFVAAKNPEEFNRIVLSFLNR